MLGAHYVNNLVFVNTGFTLEKRKYGWMCLVLLSACSASCSDALIVAHVPNLMRKRQKTGKEKISKGKKRQN